MKQQDYTQMTLEELKKKEKSTQTATYALIGIMIVQCLTGVYLTYVQGFSVFTIMPVVFIPIAVMSFGSLKKIREEIASRKH